jgi:hypothetical protein
LNEKEDEDNESEINLKENRASLNGNLRIVNVYNSLKVIRICFLDTTEGYLNIPIDIIAPRSQSNQSSHGKSTFCKGIKDESI